MSTMTDALSLIDGLPGELVKNIVQLSSCKGVCNLLLACNLTSGACMHAAGCAVPLPQAP